MSTNTTTETVLNNIKNLSLPVEEQIFTKVPGGYEVSYKGSKWFTGTKPNHDFIPPKAFTFPGNTTEVPINLKGQTEIPQALTTDYTGVSFRSPVTSKVF
jgi:hypothetical protein